MDNSRSRPEMPGIKGGMAVLGRSAGSCGHHWPYTLGGAEKALHSILRYFAGAVLHSLFGVLGEEGRQRVGYERAVTSFIQHMPGIRRRHRRYLPLTPLAMAQFDLRAYDLIISSSFAVATGVVSRPDFDIALVEAQAWGTPVIALGRGRALETAITHGQDAAGQLFAELIAKKVGFSPRRAAETARASRKSAIRRSCRADQGRRSPVLKTGPNRRGGWMRA
jgi:hypothetical protein